jgi:dephospho-CoA kinase
MITFGLTGGIACGKSTATKTFKRFGIPMVDADVVAREVVEPGSYGLRTIIDTFGSQYLNADGTMNRSAMGAFVFSNQEALDKINEIMAPLINETSALQIRRLHSKGHSVVGYDAALICEMGNADKYRPLIVVACPQQMQVERMMKRNGLGADQAMARMNSQMPTDDKVKMADYIIDTSGTVEDSIKQTKNIIYQMRKDISRYCWDCGREYGLGDKAVMCEGCGFNNPF